MVRSIAVTKPKSDQGLGCIACGSALDCPYPEERCPNLHPELLTLEHREARNEAIRALHAEGLSLYAIAERFGIGVRSVLRVVETGKTTRGKPS